MSRLASALEAAADALDASADELTRLDSLQGDGDLGRTAGLIADALRQVVQGGPADVAELLRSCGTKIAAAAPSSSGTLVAGAFLGAAKAVARDAGTTAPAALRAAASAIQSRGKAEVGDRTMLDALVPAVESLERDPADREKAARAAEVGADATRNLTAKFGRARFLAGNAIGEPDPGAVMVAVALGAAFRVG